MGKLNVGNAVTEVMKSLKSLCDQEVEIRDEYNRCHRLMIDLQHEIELSGDSYTDDMKVSVFNDMNKVSIERRSYKDQLITIGILKDIFKEGVHITDLQDKFEKGVNSWDRKYSPRVLKSLDFTDEVSLGISRLEINSKK